MKRVIGILLTVTLMMLVYSAAAELKPATEPGPKDTASPYAIFGEGENLITETLEDGSVSVKGVSSDPMPCTFADFKARFVKLLSQYDITCPFTDAIYSDGNWVYAMPAEGCAVLVKTSDQGVDGIVNMVKIIGTTDAAINVLPLSALAMAAVAKCGKTGQMTMQLLMMESEAEGYFTETPECYWFENGFDLMLGAKDDCVYADILYTQPQPVEGGFAALDIPPSMYAGIEKPVALSDLDTGMNFFGQYIGLGLPSISFSEPERLIEEYYIQAADWAECNVLAFSKTSGGPVESMLIVSQTGNTNYAWGVALGAFLTLARVPEDLILAFSFLSGENVTWDDLITMKPYAVYNGVILQCTMMNDMPTAIICGAEETGK